jgi:hypothetical protein
MVHDGGAVGGGGAGDGEAEPGVVGPGVVVEVRRRDALGRHRGHVGEGFGGRDALVALPDAQAAREVVAPHGRTQSTGDLGVHDAVAGQDRDEERQHPDKVRCVVAQALALGEGLVDQADLALLEIAQAAVDQLRALRRRA